METEASIAKDAISSGNMSLEFALELLLQESPWMQFEPFEEDGVEYFGLDDESLGLPFVWSHRKGTMSNPRRIEDSIPYRGGNSNDRCLAPTR